METDAQTAAGHWKCMISSFFLDNSDSFSLGRSSRSLFHYALDWNSADSLRFSVFTKSNMKTSSFRVEYFKQYSQLASSFLLWLCLFCRLQAGRTWTTHRANLCFWCVFETFSECNFHIAVKWTEGLLQRAAPHRCPVIATLIAASLFPLGITPIIISTVAPLRTI